MSSTNGKNKRPNDFYPTPAAVTDALLRQIQFLKGDTFLEPCRGDGAIYDRIDLPDEQKHWAEIRDGVDYLGSEFAQRGLYYDVVITNPPFSLAEEFIRTTLEENLSGDGTAAFLLRLNFIGSKKRLPLWSDVGLPHKVSVCVPRPSFTKGGTDSTEYAWFIWDFGSRFHQVPDGLSHSPSLDLLHNDGSLKLNEQGFVDARA